MSVTTRATSSIFLLAAVSGLLLVFVTPQGRAGEEVETHEAAGSDCMECHEEMREVIERPVPHEPAYEEDCTICHDPHAARYEKLLNSRERALCTACHRDAVLSFQTGEIHSPVKEGRCVVCHEVHGSEHEGLLVAEGNELCFSCHEDKHTQMSLSVVHEPFSGGECSDCHEAHNSDHAGQLVAEANSLCTVCHDVAAAEIIEAHYEIPVKGTNCKSCHDPHASVERGLLLPVAHEPFADGSCEMCHMLDTDTPRLVRATGKRLCNVCHRDYPRSDDAVIHQPVGDGDCSSCHSSHASRFEALMPGDLETTCKSCHTELDEREQVARSVHPTSFEDGSSCDACHQPHSSSEEHLLNAGGIRTCLTCHETERHGHPLGDDRLDPRTGRSITCVTCHDPHGTPFSYQLIGERTRGLCLECHDSSSDGPDARRRR